MYCALCSFCTAVIKNSVNCTFTEMKKQKKLITSVPLRGNTLNKVNRALNLLKIKKKKKTYPGNMEENSNYPEAIILSGESKNLKCLKMVINIFYVSLAQLRSGPTVDERWILLLGQWLHQGGSYYRR